MVQQLSLRITPFQSTPSVGRETEEVTKGFICLFISIHSLRGEGDMSRDDSTLRLADISIHSLRGEGDFIVDNKYPIDETFQSTPSVGRETKGVPRIVLYYTPISIHSLRGEGDQQKSHRLLPKHISIHSLRGEGDLFGVGC